MITINSECGCVIKACYGIENGRIVEQAFLKEVCVPHEKSMKHELDDDIQQEIDEIRGENANL